MMQISNIHTNAPAVPHIFQIGFKSLFTLWIRNHKTRKSLKGLEKHRLHDIGVDQSQAEAEGRKPFWQ